MKKAPFQERVDIWMLNCFGPRIAADKTESNHRFIEEALELVQSCGATASECHQLVDYVFGRHIGEPYQESGGVMVTHAALCTANHLDMQQNAETELARIWTKIEAIRDKQAAKPRHSPLPQDCDIETLDKAGTIRAIEAIQREMMAKARPYTDRLIAFMSAEPPPPVITNGGIYHYTGPLPEAPIIKTKKEK